MKEDSAPYGTAEVDFDPDSDFDPDEIKPQQTDALGLALDPLRLANLCRFSTGAGGSFLSQRHRGTECGSKLTVDGFRFHAS